MTSEISAAVEAMRDDPFIDDAHLLGTSQQDMRMEHYARVALAARPVEHDIAAIVAFQREAARYFENCPAEGEDRTFWANVYNAENCRKTASALQALAARRGSGDIVERLRQLNSEGLIGWTGPGSPPTWGEAAAAIAERDDRIGRLERERDKARQATADWVLKSRENYNAACKHLGRAERLEKALRAIAEGNLGDASWQADYEKIRQVARATLQQEGE